MKKRSKVPKKNVIGHAVRRLRLAQRAPVTQGDLSARLAARGITIDQSAIARLELGRRYVLDYEVMAIAKALRVRVERLYER